MKFRFLLLTTFLAWSCASDPPVSEGPADPLMAQVDQGCADIFQQNVLPNYEITISPDEWAALEDEFLNRVERAEMDLDLHPYHPITLSYRDETSEAMIRLKGQSSWLEAIAFDDSPKMQFVISFNEVDKSGRFHGQRKIELDMPRTDGSFLRQRIALYYLRRAGAVAQCANNATLTVNGELYGLYTHLERLDKEFLQRNFQDASSGDLWKGGRYIETNEETHSTTRIDAFWNATAAADLEGLVDLETSVGHWATEAIAAQGDGYYNGRANFFLYDHPIRGFIWIPHDLDSAFDYLPPEMSPLFPTCQARHPNDRRHWGLVMAESEGQERYVSALAEARAMYDPEVTRLLISQWSRQISEAADADPHKPFTSFDHELAVQYLIEYPEQRASTIDGFLACRDLGGANDSDGDDYADCFECDDQDREIYPGAPEQCNGKDDDCDGLVDEAEVGAEC